MLRVGDTVELLPLEDMLKATKNAKLSDYKAYCQTFERLRGLPLKVIELKDGSGCKFITWRTPDNRTDDEIYGSHLGDDCVRVIGPRFLSNKKD